MQSCERRGAAACHQRSRDRSYGKTSLVLSLCHELVLEPDCPYGAVVWISARDIDLTLRGAQPVRRGSDSLADMWTRFARLFEEAEWCRQKHRSVSKARCERKRIFSYWTTSKRSMTKLKPTHISTSS